MNASISIEEGAIYGRLPEAKSDLESKIGIYRATKDFGIDPIRGQRTKEGALIYRAIERFSAVYILIKECVQGQNILTGELQKREEFRDLYALYLSAKQSLEAITNSYKASGLEEQQNGFFEGAIDVGFKNYEPRARKDIVMNKLLSEAYLKKVKAIARNKKDWEAITKSFFAWVLEQTKKQMLAEEYSSFIEESNEINGSIDKIHFSGLEFYYGSRPSETPNKIVTLDDIGGNSAAKKEIRSVINHYKYLQIYDAWASEIPRGILLVGPSGTGKTLLAKAVSQEIKGDFYEIKCSDILDSYVGVSEQRLSEMLSRPGIFFFDEFDALGRRRGGTNQDYVDRLVNELLTHMDGFSSRADQVFLAATNNEPLVDEAFKRPGRFDYTIRIDLPDYEGLMEILKIHTSKREQKAGRELFSNIDYSVIVKAMTNFSGADVEQVVNRILNQKGDEHVALIIAKGTEDVEMPCLPTTEEFLEVIGDYRIEKRKGDCVAA